MHRLGSLSLALCLLVPAGCGIYLGDDGDPSRPSSPDDSHGSETDAGAGAGAGGSGGGGGGGAEGDFDGGVSEPEAARRVFATRGLYRGDFTAYQDAGDGLAAADAICQLRADAAELGGTWIAWLSSSEVDAIDRVVGEGPWERTDGAVAFQNRAQLQTEPLVALDRDEFGAQLDDCFCGRVYAWTGTRIGGERHEETCADWSNESAFGRYGQAPDYQTPSSTWTDYATSSCDDAKRILCLEL